MMRTERGEDRLAISAARCLHGGGEVLRRQDVHQAHALGRFRLEHSRRQQQVERVHGADQPRQHPGDAVLGDQPAPGKGGGELGPGGHVADIAIERQHQANAGHGAVDAGDQRFA